MPHYVKNKELLPEIIKCKELGELTPRAVEMLILIAENSNRKLSYEYDKDKEDCISGAIEDMLRYWDRFNPEKSTNAFSFYTQMAKNGFAKTWKKLYKKKTMSLSTDGVAHRM